MIRWEHVSVTYPGDIAPVLRDVDLEIAEGAFCLVVGGTGSGKSTLLGTICGLVPHFTGGTLDGRVTVADRDTATHPPRDLADLVGVVPQDPLAGFVTDTVEEELAYGMEQLALPADTMRKRVEETLDLLGIAELRDRPLRELSGGQQQRVAIGAVLTAHPSVLVLDEPTSSLDPTAAEDVLATITRLVHDLGVTAVVAEHRLERVVHYADQIIVVDRNGAVATGEPRRMLTRTDIAPPIIELGRLARWDPLPLSVRDARRQAGALRARLADLIPPPPRPHGSREVALDARGVVVRHGDTVAVRGVDLSLAVGEITALMGRNGSGKSSLLWAIQGSGPRDRGTVEVDGQDPAALPASEARRLIGLVPQTPSDLLYLLTVGAECDQADRDADRPAGTCRSLLDRLTPDIDGGNHPRDLSEGQRLALVLAVQLTAAPEIVLLDEPTRGLDVHAKARLTQVLSELAAEGRSIVVATHDVEFVAATATRVVVLADGDVVADGDTTHVIGSSPAFAPQVAKILSPEPWLTVDQIAGALAAEESTERTGTP